MNAESILSIIRSMNKLLTTIEVELSHFMNLTDKKETNIYVLYFKLMDRREKQFNAYVVFNRRFSQLLNQLTSSKDETLFNENEKISFKEQIKAREKSIQSIKLLDEKLSSWIHRELSSLNQQLQIANKEIQLLGKFKSGSTNPRGEQWDQTL